jgi:hypothetical protein
LYLIFVGTGFEVFKVGRIYNADVVNWYLVINVSGGPFWAYPHSPSDVVDFTF